MEPTSPPPSQVTGFEIGAGHSARVESPPGYIAPSEPAVTKPSELASEKPAKKESKATIIGTPKRDAKGHFIKQ